MNKLIVGIIVFVMNSGAASSENLSSKDDSIENGFSVLKTLMGDWFRWDENPQVFDTWVAPGIRGDSQVWSGISLSEKSIIFAGTSMRDGRLFNLLVFESADGAVKLFTYHRGADDILRAAPVKTLDAKASNNSSLLWRDSEGSVVRFLFSGEGKSLRMSWDTWDKVFSVWNRNGIPFRRDPPPNFKKIPEGSPK